MRIQSTNFQTVTRWVARILRLDFGAFAEIRAEPRATFAAILVVLVASLLAGAGSWLWAIQYELISAGDVFVRSFLLGGVIQTLVWFLWVYGVFQILARVYGMRLDFAELTRTMGFSFAPVGLSVLVALEPLAVPFGMIAMGIALLFANAAIQEATDADLREATIANLAGFVGFVVIMGAIAHVERVQPFGGLAPGIFFLGLDL